MPFPIVSTALTAAPIVASLFQKKRGAPDVSGELARLSAIFNSLREQQTTNINREAASGRTAAASNLAARGIYRAPVSQHTFNQLESDRVNSIANANAQLSGQEASLRASLLGQLLGYQNDANLRADQATAGRFGAITGIGSNLLLARLLRGDKDGGMTLPGWV